MKKWIFGGLGLTAIALGTTLYTGAQYREFTTLQMTQLQQPGLEYQLEVLSEGLFGRTEQYTFTLHPEMLFDPSQLTQVQQLEPWTLVIRQDAHYWPLMVTGSMLLDFQQGIAADWLAGLEVEPKQESQWSLSLLSQDIDYHYRLGAMTLQDEEDSSTLRIQPFTVSGNAPLDLSELTTRLQWQGMEVSGPEAKLRVSDVSAQTKGVLQSGLWSTSDTEITLGEIALEVERDNLVLSGLTLLSAVKESQDSTYTLLTQLHLDTLDYREGEDQQISARQLRFDMDLPAIDSEIYQAAQQMNQQWQPAQAQQQLIALADLWLSRGFQVRLADFRGELDINQPVGIGVLIGDFKAQGEMTITADSLADLQAPGALLAALKAQLNLNFSDTLFEKHPVGTMVVGPRLQTGHFRQEENRISTVIEFQQGQATLNGLPL